MSSNLTPPQKSGPWLLKPFGFDSSLPFMPKVDVKEDKNNVIATAELPGITDKDIEVSVRDDVLILRGEKKSEKEEQQKHFYRIERSYGSFERSLSLPCEVQPNKAEAVFKNGILTVTMPKSATARTTEKKLTVKSV